MQWAAYIDEVSDDPRIACATMRDVGINQTILRRVWSDKICELNDKSCSILRDILSDNGVTPISIHTCTSIVNKDTIKHALDIAAYFKAPMLCVDIDEIYDFGLMDELMNDLTMLCVRYDIVPLFELAFNNKLWQPADIATLMNKHFRWNIVYDPVALTIKNSRNAYVAYFVLLESRVSIVDVADFKIGRGMVPVGEGDCMTLETVADAIDMDITLAMEPRIGNKYKGTNIKHEAFKMVFNDTVGSIRRFLSERRAKGRLK